MADEQAVLNDVMNLLEARPQRPPPVRITNNPALNPVCFLARNRMLMQDNKSQKQICSWKKKAQKNTQLSFWWKGKSSI